MLKTMPFRLITDHQALKEILKESGGEKNLDHPLKQTKERIPY
jgi:hypothetical protein